MPTAAATASASSRGASDDDPDDDGVRGQHDMCPEAAEDCDAFADADGCPDDDNDEDRTPDRCDRCPNEPETWNGFDDDDGCPERSRVIVTDAQNPPLPIVPAQRSVRIIERIYFARGSSDLRPVSFPILDEIARLLADFPDVELVGLIGRASSDERRQVVLSQRRAQAVLEALVARGVARERLEAHGIGTRRPITQDREQERSVESVLMRRAGVEAYRWTGTDVEALPLPPEPPAVSSPPPPRRPVCEPPPPVRHGSPCAAPDAGA